MKKYGPVGICKSERENIVCSEEESIYILQLMEGCLEEDNKVHYEKRLGDIKIKYLNNTKKWRNVTSREIIKRAFEECISSNGLSCGNMGTKKIKGSDNLYRIGMHEKLWSAMVVFSINGNEIEVKIIERFFTDYAAVKEELIRIKNDYPKVLSTVECIDYILKNNCSLVRFGDGEINICNGLDMCYQFASIELQARLQEVLKHGSSSDILVTIPEFCSKYNNLYNYTGRISWWEDYWLRMFDRTKQLFTDKFYGNTDIARNTVYYENKLDDIKKLWNKRDVVFVLGDKGRFEIKPELFDNILSHEIIFVPPVNAYETYQNILDSSRKQSKEKLFLSAAGPTANILSFDLSNLGYQALDIGHMPNCYDQYLGGRSPEEIPYIRRKSTPYAGNFHT